MDQNPVVIENIDAPALVEEDVSEKSFVKLIDTLLLTVINITAGIGKISKTLNDTDILEFIIEMPLINTNIIIQYNLKSKEQSVNKNFYLVNIPETVLDIKRESDECHLELQDSNLAVVHGSNYDCDKGDISCNDDLNNHKEYRKISITNIESEISEESICSGSNIKSSSCSATNEKPTLSKERYHCSICEKSFSTLTHKKTHERIHSGERPFLCAVCGKSFSIASNKKRHERIHTGEKPYSCSVCGKSFICLFNKNSHERIHSKERLYSCCVCGKLFTKQSNKVAHEKLHEKPYSCGICGQRFLKVKNKRKHEKTHTNEKPYFCSYCPKSFSTSSNKSAHERIHTGERPFACAICGKTFTRNYEKKRHERIHIGEKPYSCTENRSNANQIK